MRKPKQKKGTCCLAGWIVLATSAMGAIGCGESIPVPKPALTNERFNNRERLELGRQYQTLRATKQTGAVNGSSAFCDDGLNACGVAEGDCDSDAQCAGNLVCGADNGSFFGIQDNFDVCWASHCGNGKQDGDETGLDCGGGCGYGCQARLVHASSTPPAADFSLFSTTGVQDNPWHLTQADLDGDGNFDLAAVARRVSKANVLLGRGDGSFESVRVFNTQEDPFGIATADLNGDQILDLVTANNNSNSLTILWGSGNRSNLFPSADHLSLAPATNAGPTQVAIGNFNGDTKLDLAVANWNNDTVAVFLAGASAGHYPNHRVLNAGVNRRPRSIVAADFNEDGYDDIALGLWDQLETALFLWNPSAGGFDAPVYYDGGNQQVNIQTGDLNGDGILDLAVVNMCTNSVTLLKGLGSCSKGNGTFEKVGTLSTGSVPVSVDLTDLNCDNVLDLSVAEWGTSKVSVYLGHGDFTYESPSSYSVGANPAAAVSLKANADATWDIASCNYGPDTVSVLVGTAACGCQDACEDDNPCTQNLCVGGQCDFSQPATAGTPCGMLKGACDIADFCDGVNLTCPDEVEDQGVVCRPIQVGDNCDMQEVCDGISPVCPIDAVKPADVMCRAAPGECDVPEFCPGPTGSQPKRCPTDAFESNAVVCRDVQSGDDCDLPERCSGTSPDCPNDSVRPASWACRWAQADCDQTEYCPGPGPAASQPKRCPADEFRPNTVLCRGVQSGDDCDLAEFCTGTSRYCPADMVRSEGTICRLASGTCDLPEGCPGPTGSLPKRCPQDQLRSNNALCRQSRGGCDPAEYCTGQSPSCPSNVLYGPGVVCNPSVDPNHPECDPAEVCDGQRVDCPTDRVAPFGDECGDQTSGDCDGQDVCDGKGYCYPNYSTEGTPCPDNEFCNGEETCDGAGNCLDRQDPCPSDNNQCTLDYCDSTLEECVVEWIKLPDGTFGEPIPFSIDSNPYYIVFADFNRDGQADLATANLGDDSVSILLGQTHAPLSRDYFQSVLTVDLEPGDNPVAVAAGDLDGDQNLDLVTANAGSSSVTILWGQPNGLGYAFPYQSKVELATSEADDVSPAAVVVGDFNGNRRLDIIVANRFLPSVALIPDKGEQFSREFLPIQFTLLPPDTYPRHLAAGDLNGDNNLDLVVVVDSGALQILYNDDLGIGLFEPAHSYLHATNHTFLKLDDIDGDDQLDAVTSTNQPAMAILDGDGAGSFSGVVCTSGLTGSPSGLDVADVNGDNLKDVVVAEWGANSVSVFLGGAGLCPLDSPTRYPAGPMPAGAVFGDFTGDGLVDIAVPSFSHDRVSVLPARDICFGAHCGDGLRNGDETDVDCGGSCPACP